MFNKLEYSNRLEEIDNFDNLKLEIYSEFAKHGVTSLSYNVACNLSKQQKLLNEENRYFSNHPQEWLDSVGKEILIENNLSTTLAIRSDAAFFWHDKDHWENATRHEKALFELEENIGLTVGLTVRVNSLNQKNISIFRFATKHISKTEFGAYWAENKVAIMEVANISNMIIQERFLPELCKKINLKERHKIFLRYFTDCSNCYTDYKNIAHAMGKSKYTIEQIVREINKKLNTTKINEAAFKAIYLNLI